MINQVVALVTGAFSPLLSTDDIEVDDVVSGDRFDRLVEHSATTAIQGQGDVVLGYGNSIGEAQMKQLFEEATHYDFSQACKAV